MTAHAAREGALRVRLADGETCHADDLAAALAGLLDGVEALDAARTAAAEWEALRRVAGWARDAGALAAALGVVVPWDVTP
jgi:hypothetical protein